MYKNLLATEDKNMATEKTSLNIDKSILERSLDYSKKQRVSLSKIVETLLGDLLDGRIESSIPLIFEEPQLSDDNLS